MARLRNLRATPPDRAVFIVLTVTLLAYNGIAGGVGDSHPVSQGDRVFLGVSLLGGVLVGHLGHRQDPRAASLVLGLLAILPVVSGLLALSMTGDVHIGPRLPWCFLGIAAGVVQARALAERRARRAISSDATP